MDIIISNSADKPIYEQIKEQIKNKILAGTLNAGELLPSIRTLAKDLHVSAITTKNAYIELEKEGYVETLPGKGTYVANKNLELAREEQLRNIEGLLNEVVNIAKLTGIERKEIDSLLDIIYKEDYNE